MFRTVKSSSSINTRGFLRTDTSGKEEGNKPYGIDDRRENGSMLLSFSPYILSIVGIIEGPKIVNLILGIEHTTNSTAVTLINAAYYVSLTASSFLLRYIDKKL